MHGSRFADFGEIGVLSASRMREHAGSRFDVLSTHGSRFADFGEIGVLSASRTNMHGSRLPISEKSAYLPMHTSSSWRMVPSSLAMRTKMWS